MKKLSWSTTAPRRTVAPGLLLGPVLLADSPGFDPGRDSGGNWRELRRE